MTTNDLLQALARLRVETGSLACLGCGHEHNCSTHGCQILRKAAARLKYLETEKAALLPYAKEYGCETCKDEKACFVQTREGVTVSCVECPVPDTCPCSQCKDCDKWEWRGLPESPEGEKT